ncbi:hypothetical protein [Niabella hibiscisoli]|uniref:hypothetical protein n=1 Tax=Niabella hibiscisoli TaxID=1825928 RepID=UPI001F0F4025|nr:hypothetical protein [Niabella hibiscisoli]MCH5719964.1 hypothetical protein [Niabella hibiscisoli]
MTYSAVLLKKLRLPSFAQTEQGLYGFDWSEIKEVSDWNYPLGVTAYLFSRVELLSILKVVNFKAPNSLESALQVYLPLFEKRQGLCTQNAIAVCVHANLTQTEYINPALGNFSIEELLKKWKQGLQIDFRKFYNLPMTTSQLADYEFITRSNG